MHRRCKECNIGTGLQRVVLRIIATNSKNIQRSEQYFTDFNGKLNFLIKYLVTTGFLDNITCYMCKECNNENTIKHITNECSYFNDAELELICALEQEIIVSSYFYNPKEE